VTRIGIISDVHGDVHALRDALAQIDKIGVDRIVCCGDIVDYGLFPDETIALLRARDVIAIRGNHDRWAIKGDALASSDGLLTEPSLAWLASLPPNWRTVVDGVRIVVWHARPRSDMNGVAHDAPYHELRALLDNEDADVLLVGHTHVPSARRLGIDAMVANLGVLLRDAGPGCDVATPGLFGILEIGRGGAVEFEVRRAIDGVLVEP